MLQYEDKGYASSYNIGPEERDCITTGEICSIFTDIWKDDIKWKAVDHNGPYEANFLKLEITKAKNILHWKPLWNVREAVQRTVEWSKAYYNREDIEIITNKQIEDYLKEIIKWKE